MRLWCSFLLLAGAVLAEPELPRIGTVGDEPPAARTVVLVLDRDGTIRAGDEELSFAQLRARLLEAGKRHAGGRLAPSGANALLRADARLPWVAIQWVLTACAEAKIARVHYAVRPEEGEDAGAFALFLPIDRWGPVAQEPIATRYLHVLVRKEGVPATPAALFFAMRDRLAKAKNGRVEIRATLAAPYGLVLGLADAAVRAGAVGVDLYGTMIPPRDADLKALVRKTGVLDAAALFLDGRALEPSARKMPPVARRRGIVGLTDESPLEEELEEEPEEEPDEEFVEEPIETEEVVDHDDAGGGEPAERREPVVRKRSAPRVARKRVERALAWLAARQDPKAGFWTTGAENVADTRATALSLLAFLGAGYSDREAGGKNPYTNTVRQGLRALMDRQADDGGFGQPTAGNAAATLALCEAYWITRNPRYKKPALDGLNWLARARNPYLGWGDGARDGSNNTLATGWAVLATRSGKSAGLDVDPDAFEGGRQWIEKVTDPKNGTVGFAGPGDGARTPVMTALATLTRILLGEDPRTSDVIARAADYCGGQTKGADVDFWYFGSLAMFQVGGQHWKAWNDALSATIPRGQGENGSWGDDVRATALSTMCLEVHYRYARVAGTR